MLRKARILLSVVFFGLITFYFLDFAEILPNSFHRLAHVQFTGIGIIEFYNAGGIDTDNTVLRPHLLFHRLSDGCFSGYSDLDF